MFPVLLVTALCVDAFTASFSYGVSDTKIPIRSALVISFVCTAVLSASMGLGSAVRLLLPKQITSVLSFAILIVLGLLKSFESAVKRFVAKKQKLERQIKIFDVCFVLTVYADNMRADMDHSKELSAKEAVYLALALSLDGLAAGFGYALVSIDFIRVAVLSLISNALAIELGLLIGKMIAKRLKLDLTWVGGLMLILMAFTKL